MPKDKPIKVLVLCHGNRWRSVTCVAALQNEDFSNGRLQIRTAGFAHPGKKPSFAILSYCQSVIGVDMERHRSAIVTSDDIKWADHIIYMDGGNRKRLDEMIAHTPFVKARPLTHMLGAYHKPKPLKRIRDPAFMATASDEFRSTLDGIVVCAKEFYSQLTKPKASQGKLI